MNFIFDIGNVLINYQPLQFLEKLLNDTPLAKKIFHIIFRCPEWEQLDQGLLSHKEATGIFCMREPDYAPAIRKSMQNLNDMFTPVPASIETLTKIKDAGHNLYLLSNIHTEIKDYLLKKHEFFSLFCGGVFSCDVHVTKPACEIYRLLLEKYSLPPEDCLFFDDSEKNVAAAEKEGIKSIHFSGSSCIKPFI